jgi:chitodextrinase
MQARRAIPGGRASFFATAVLAAVLPLLGAAPASGSVSVPAAVCGTWVLLQPTTAADLSNARPDIEQALALPGVVGFSLRFTWKAVDTDFSLLEQGLAIARSKGKGFAIRPMAGRHTPARVFEAGSPFYTLGSGEKVPTPFSPDGSPNVVFEQAYDEFVGRLAAWSRANGVRLLHLPWYGQDWAELNHGLEVRSAPGYSLNAWLGAHRRLIDIGARYSGPDLAVEMPLSGSGPLANGPSAALADYVVSAVGAASERFFVQANGWGPSGDWGTTSATTEAQFDQIWLKPVRRGEQAIQAEDYDWPVLFATLYANDATYAEVYLRSFSLARKASLAAEINTFAATRCATPAPVDSTPPTVAVSSPAAGERLAGALGVSLTADDDEGPVTEVELLVDGAVAGSAAAAAATIAWDTTTVGDGTHVLGARATDEAGNTAESPPVGVIVDNTAPSVPGGLSSTPGDSEVTVAFEAVTEADLAGYEVRTKSSESDVWEAPMSIVSTSAVFNGLVNGTSYDFAVRSRDDLGNTSVWSTVVSAVPVSLPPPDDPAPTVVISAPEDGTRVGGNVEVSIGAADASGSVIEVELLVDGDAVGTVAASSAAIPWDSTTVADGIHVVRARATDDDGNVGTSLPVSVVVDNTAPGTPGGLSAMAGDGQVTVTFDAVTAADLAAYDVRSKPSAAATWGPPVATALTTRTFSDLTNDTSYDFSVRSRDDLDNTSAWSEAVSASPGVPAIGAPVVAITAPADGVRVAGTVDVSLETSSDGVVVEVALLVDGTPVDSVAASSGTISWDSTTVADGAHGLSARAVDNAGNVGTSPLLALMVDNTAPAVPGGLTATPDDGQVTVEFQAVDASDLAGYDVRMKPSSSSTWDAPLATTSATATFTGLTNGTSYDFSVRSRDTLGNISAWSAVLSATPVFSDTTAPAVVVVAPANGAGVAGTIDVSIEASDAGSVVEVALLVDGVDVGSAAAPSATIPWDSTTLADGVHALSGRAVDDVGNVGTSLPVSVVVDNTAPGVPGGLSAVPGDGQVTVTFDAVNASDLSGYDVRLKSSSSSTWGAPVALTSAPATFTGLVNATSYDVSVRSRDTLGNTSAWSATASATPVAPDTTAPVVAVTGPAGGARLAGTVAVSITASDAGSVTRVELLVDGQLVGSVAASSAAIAWDTRTVAGGAHGLTARAVDAAGNVGTSPSVSVIVDNTAPAVPGGLIAAPGDRRITVTFQAVSASDLAGYDVRLKPSASSTWGAPVAVTSATATFTGLTNGASYDVAVRSRDTLGNTSAWSATVSATPQAPDTQAPTVPTGLRVPSITRNSLQVCWNASTDNVGVAGYRVYRNGVLVATTTSTCQVIGNLTRNTSYTITVRAFDAAGNVSAAGSVTARTRN